MGAWGVKLNENDVYCDVKDAYLALLRFGMSDEEATKSLIDEFSDYVDDSDDSSVFWFSLADIQWQYGRLIPSVKLKAIECIDSGNDLKNWLDVSKESFDERKQVLQALKNKLSSPQPKPKLIRKKRYSKCEWKDGDIFRYEFVGRTAEKYGMAHKFVFLQKIGEYFLADPYARKMSDSQCIFGDRCPIVRFWISEDRDFIPLEQDRNACLANGGVSYPDGTYCYQFYIFNIPKKNSSMEYICNAPVFVPDNESMPHGLDDLRHINWKYFEWQVLRPYIYAEKHILIDLE